MGQVASVDVVDEDIEPRARQVLETVLAWGARILRLRPEGARWRRVLSLPVFGAWDWNRRFLVSS